MWIFWFIFLLVLGICLLVYSWSDIKLRGEAGSFGIILIAAAYTILSENISEPNPTALDVYRGNTELEIKSINGIPVDTVVVFKNK